MTIMRTIEVFTANCPCCDDAVNLVRRLACSSCSITVYNTNDQVVHERMRALGIHSVPAVVVDGVLVRCCDRQGVDEASLKAAGVGQAA